MCIYTYARAATPPPPLDGPLVTQTLTLCSRAGTIPAWTTRHLLAAASTRAPVRFLVKNELILQWCVFLFFFFFSIPSLFSVVLLRYFRLVPLKIGDRPETVLCSKIFEDSDCNEERFDFKMVCFFFLSVIPFSNDKNAPIFSYDTTLDKVNDPRWYFTSSLLEIVVLVNPVTPSKPVTNPKQLPILQSRLVTLFLLRLIFSSFPTDWLWWQL